MRFGPRIAPVAGLFGAGIVSDAAKLGKHDRLAAVGEAVQRQNAPCRTALVKQGALRFGRFVARTQLFGIGVVVVDARDIGSRCFPAVDADHRTGAVKRLG